MSLPHSTDINGFKFLHKHRQNRIGGGVGLYLSNELEFKLREDLSISNVDIVVTSGKKYSCWYCVQTS